MMPAWSRKYVGIPYKAHGRGMEGVDCYGLLKLVFQSEFGIEIPDYLYAENFTADAFSGGMNDSCWEQLVAGREQLGDVVLMMVKGKPFHVGMILEPVRMLHVLRTGLSSCIERYDSPRWSNRVAGFYGHRGLYNG